MTSQAGVVRTRLLRLCGNGLGSANTSWRKGLDEATPEKKIKETIRQIGAALREDAGVSSYIACIYTSDHHRQRRMKN